MNKKRKKLTTICACHYVKLIYRSLLLLLALVTYVIGRIRHSGELFQGYEHDFWLLTVIWLVFAVEMAFRFFPSKLESMGCQKQFQRNYQPTEENAPQMQSWKRTLAVIVAWGALNSVIGLLYYTNLIDAGILILISLAYSVCDMICILFFCPFQTWFMKNRCCTTCRIYNWDFAMMFTPLGFLPSVYTYTLLGFSLLLLLRWEITYRMHPERFATNTNRCLDCSRCKEKLCSHKRQLRGFLKKYKDRFFGNNEKK